MANNVQIKFDFDNKELEIASGKVLSLTQQIRILKKELGKEGYSQEQFEIMSKTVGDLEDNFARTTARSKDFLLSLQLIPGPIGEIAGKVNGAIGLLKTFSGFKLDDIKFQFKETIDDIKDIGQWLGKATGITKIYTVLNNALASSFVKVGVGEAAAAAGARAFSAALVATGVGALVVGLGLAVSALMDFADSSDEAEKQQKELGDQIQRVNQLLNMDLADASRRQKLRLAEMRKNGATEGQLRTQSLEDLKENLKLTQNALQENYALESKVLKEGTGNLDEIYKQQLDLEEKRDQLINDIRVGEIDNERQTNEERKAQRTKNLQNAKQAAQEQRQFEQQILGQRKESLDTQIQNEKDSATTSEATLKTLYAKRNKLDLDELSRAEMVAKQQLKDKKITSQEYNDIIAGIEAKRVKIAQDTTKAISSALDEDKKVEEDRVKSAEDFARKIRDIKTNSIVDDVAREKQSRLDKYNDEVADLEKDKEFIKLSETQKAEVRKALLTTFNNDIDKINKTQKDKDIEDDMKAYDRKLRILELQGQGLLKGTKAYFQNREEILKTTQEQELQTLKNDLDADKLTREEYQAAVTATEQKYVNLRKQLKQEELAAVGQTISATLDAFANLGNALASTYDEEAKTSEKAFEKRKKLQIATAVMSAASGLVQILTQPSVLPSPFDWITKGINAIALGIATKVNIDKIKSTKFEAPSGGESAGAAPYKVTANRASGGMVTGPGTSTSDSINARLSNGEFVVNARATSAFLPLLNAINDRGLRPRFANGGLVATQSPSMIATENISRAITDSFVDRPVKTYVVGQDMSNQQQFDRVIKSRSTI